MASKENPAGNESGRQEIDDLPEKSHLGKPEINNDKQKLEFMWMDWHFAVQNCNLSQQHFETDTHILGRCISCYKNKRGAEYVGWCSSTRLFGQLHAVNVNKMGTVSQNVDKNYIMMVKMHST